MSELSGRKQKKSHENTGSSNNGDHSDRSAAEPSPPVLRARKKRNESKDRRKTLLEDNLAPSGADKKTSVQSVPIPVDIPPLPSGKTLLDISLSIQVDDLFELLFSESGFYKKWLFVRISFLRLTQNMTIPSPQDPRHQVDTKNLSSSKWIKNETTGLLERDLTYDRFQDFVITTATIKVSQKQVRD